MVTSPISAWLSVINHYFFRALALTSENVLIFAAKSVS